MPGSVLWMNIVRCFGSMGWCEKYSSFIRGRDFGLFGFRSIVPFTGRSLRYGSNDSALNPSTLCRPTYRTITPAASASPRKSRLW